MQTGLPPALKPVAPAVNNALLPVNNTVLAGRSSTLVLAGGDGPAAGLTLRDLTVLWRRRDV